MVTPDARFIDYGYDAGNRLGQITLSSLAFNLSYDLAGRRTALSFPNGVSTSYSYNEASFLTSLVARDSQQTTINSFNYTPDGIGSRTSMTDLTGQHSYTYDDTYQLTQATHPNMPTEQFGYDAVGNRAASGQPTPSLSTSLYAYDFENRLTDVSYSDMAVHYKYDPFGRRIEKNVDGTITKYVYDGPNIVTQYDGDWNLQGKYLFTLDIDDPLMVTQGANNFYYHKDGLGSVVNLTDSSQTTVNGYTYKSFGDIYSETGSVVQPFTFTGREYDPESGLYYYRARYYDPRAGRFLTKDPIGFGGGDLNLYRYVQNNPINFTDPFGLKRGDWWDPRTYIEISQSYTYLMEGKQINRTGTEQWMLSFFTFIGRSIDVQIGGIPCEKDIQFETSVGLGKHLGIGLYFAAPAESGPIYKAGIAFHFGYGLGSPITLSGTLDVDSKKPRWW